MRLQERPRRRAAINITSLIDVIFMLLLFFMISSTFLEQPGIKLELPAAKAEAVGEPQEYVLTVDRQGALFLNRRPLDLESLEGAIREALPRMQDAALVLKADQAVSHGLVVRVMDLAKRGGVRKLVIGTKPEN